MSIQERDYMNRDEQRKFADKFKLDGMAKAPESAVDYNNQEQWNININKPKVIARPASYDDVRFDESDEYPGDEGEAQGSLLHGLGWGVIGILGLVGLFWLAGGS